MSQTVEEIQRSITIRQNTNIAARKKLLVITEEYEREGVTWRATKRMKYWVIPQPKVEIVDNIKKLQGANIVREGFNPPTKAWIVSGCMYVVQDCRTFLVIYRNTVKMEML